MSSSRIARSFFDLSEKDLEEAEQIASIRRAGFGRSAGWDDVLQSRLIILMSEAQSGKTYECKAQSAALWAAGDAAFYVELASVATQAWRDLRSPEESERLERWRRNDAETATIFLDSVDELALTQGSFRAALRNVANDLAGVMRRVRIILTSRPLPVDRTLFLQTFAAPPPTKRLTEDDFARLALGKQKDHDKEKAAPEVRYIALLSLNRSDVAHLAEERQVTPVEPFLDALDAASMMDFMRRPQDVIEAASAWSALNGAFGTHAQQVAFDVRARLKPNPERNDRDIEPARALDGAKRLALAVALTGRLTIRHDVNRDPLDAATVVDPDMFLSDWSIADRKALLERGLFGFASYGRVRFHIRITPEIEQLLRDARVHPTYADQGATLHDRLLVPTLGYANARDAVARTARADMASMPAASARIGRYTNLADPEVIRIDRKILREAIAAWWSLGEPRPPLALLGTEGMGKTWSALSWWLDRELVGNLLPLTLIVPARFTATASADAIIGGALAQLMSTRDAAWWARRARRWCATAQHAKIVLIIDGLNERFDAGDWAALAAELRLEPWANAVELIITDRDDHWRRIAGGFQAAQISCTEVPVGPFDDTELDEILGRAGLRREKLDRALLPLLRVPRLCSLALRHWKRLLGSGDISAERLVYEDFRDRIYPSLDDQDMRNLIATIGETLRATSPSDITVLRRDVAEALAAESGAQSSDATISAIVSGVWFTPIPGEPHRFRINPELAPIAMALALVRAVQSGGTEAEIAGRIEAFVDDLRGLQLGVTLIGIAASFATITPECGPIARKVLLDTWLGSDNFESNELRRVQAGHRPIIRISESGNTRWGAKRRECVGRKGGQRAVRQRASPCAHPDLL